MRMIEAPGRRRALQLLVGATATCVALQLPAVAAATTVRRRIRSTINLRNPSGRALKEQALWCYLPMSDGERQKLVHLDISTKHRLLSDSYGHSILQIDFKDFPPFGFRTVPMTATVDLIDPPAARTPDTAPTWLAPERFIESDDPRILELSRSLREASVLGTARAIYQWVSANLVYAGYLADDLGALYALTNRRGDCTEYANLVVALARASGIPARMVGGYVMDRDGVTIPQEYHNWAELFLEGRWGIVDAQKRAWLPAPSTYIAYRVYRDRAVNPVGNAHRFRLAGELQVAF